MIQITITETENIFENLLEDDDTLEITSEAITLLERAEESLDIAMEYSAVKGNRKLSTQLSNISNLLFSTHLKLSESIGYNSLDDFE
jgi:hypothetical protein